MALERLDELVGFEKTDQVVGGACFRANSLSASGRETTRARERTGENEVVFGLVEGKDGPDALLVAFQGVRELPVLPDSGGPAWRGLDIVSGYGP